MKSHKSQKNIKVNHERLLKYLNENILETFKDEFKNEQKEPWGFSDSMGEVQRTQKRKKRAKLLVYFRNCALI